MFCFNAEVRATGLGPVVDNFLQAHKRLNDITLKRYPQGCLSSKTGIGSLFLNPVDSTKHLSASLYQLNLDASIVERPRLLCHLQTSETVGQACCVDFHRVVQILLSGYTLFVPTEL
jgi:hypothetical protein